MKTSFWMTLGLAAVLASAPASAQQFVDYTMVAAPGSIAVAPGLTIPALVYNGQLPGPTLYGTVGQTLRVRLVNQLPHMTSLHMHGLKVPHGMDGVIGLSRPGIAPSQEFTYEIPLTHSGTYWYHPHVEDQMSSGLYGAIIVAPADPTADPYSDLDHTVILHDETTAAGGFLGGMMGGTDPGITTHLMNGKTSAGQVPLIVQPGGKLRLRLVNAAMHTTYAVALDGHTFEVTHADGHRVQSVNVPAIPIGPGERYDAVVTLANPGTWSLAAADLANRNLVKVRGIVQYAGSNVPAPSDTFVPASLASGTLLDYGMLAAYAPIGTLTALPNQNYNLALAMAVGPSGISFTINGQAWPNVTPMATALGETVQLTFANTMMGGFRHPMHMHGHFMLLAGTAGGNSAPPVKDTVLIAPFGQAWSVASVQLLADVPGNWVLHCHDIDHMMMGMMTLLTYGGDSDGDGLPDAADWDPTSIIPSLALAESGASFALGGSGSVVVQAPQFSIAHLFLGLPATLPRDVPPFGTVFIDLLAPYTLVGAATAGPSMLVDFPYTVPPVPALSGSRFALQAVAFVPAAPGGLLTRWHPLTIQ